LERQGEREREIKRGRERDVIMYFARHHAAKNDGSIEKPVPIDNFDARLGFWET
jgi:hypothetical protein